MFTLSQARAAVGSASQFARGGAFVQEGRVRGVTVREEGTLLIYEGEITGAAEQIRARFEYDTRAERFAACRCTCADALRLQGGCRHVAALMIAACGGAGEPVGAREGGEFMDALLDESRIRPSAMRFTAPEEPVQLAVTIRRVSGREAALSLKIGRSRFYVVRSMTEFAQRAQKRETAVYGKELTFSHSESELCQGDAALFGQIVMLAGDEHYASGGELRLSGAALDQTMRLLIGRMIEIKDENGALRRARVVLGEMTLPVELEQENARAQLRIESGDTVLGSTGAYQFGAEKLVCAFGSAFTASADLLRIGAQYPQGVRFDEKRLEEICTRILLPAGASAVIRKGQHILAAHTPTPATPKLYVDMPTEKRLVCRAAFDYCGTEISGDGEYPHIRRDTALEEDVRQAAAQLFPQKISDWEWAFEGDDEEIFELLSTRLPQLERAGEVMVSKRLTQKHVKRARAMTFGLTQQDDKLVLKADLGGYTQEELSAALAAYRQKREYVRLESGTFLSGEALAQAADAAQVLDDLDMTAEQAQQGADVPMSRAAYLDAALKKRESIRLSAPKAVTDWVERLQNAQQTKVEQPAGLRAQLRDYQKTGLCWLSALCQAGFGGILADDMGLGKTIQALAMLQSSAEAGETVRALVVCPASLQLNWLSEAKKFVPELTSAALLGTAQERAQQIASKEPPHILITSYDQLRRDVQAYQDAEFSHILLDEAQNIKNAASQAAKAVKTIRAKHRFAMTGTPIENRLSELWSIFDFLMPGYLGAYKKFKERYEAPVVRDADERAREDLHLLVAPFILRRMKKDVLTDLPEKVESVMTSEMTAEQRKLYTAYIAQIQAKDKDSLLGSRGQMEMLAALTKLRQLCCDPRLCLENYHGGSGKLAQLLEVVQEALGAGHRILLFSQFTSMLELIGEALDGLGIGYLELTGETDKETRMELVQQFNAGDPDVFLISLKAGGTGLNLTGADVVIHYDPWWNVSAQNQATDRAYRIGQTKGVQVIRLIAADTVEEHILNIQERKRALSDGVLLGEENLFTMDAEVLREVLGM